MLVTAEAIFPLIKIWHLPLTKHNTIKKYQTLREKRFFLFSSKVFSFVLKMEKKELIRRNDSIFRVLSVQGEEVLLIDCIKRNMPKWWHISDILTWKNPSSVFAETVEYGKFNNEIVLFNNSLKLEGQRGSIFAKILIASKQLECVCSEGLQKI